MSLKGSTWFSFGLARNWFDELDKVLLFIKVLFLFWILFSIFYGVVLITLIALHFVFGLFGANPSLHLSQKSNSGHVSQFFIE